ncbi:hypothetical protein BDV98DRAFT_603303 [Pterulicium gracile]|uniref:Uncharacterized protein n=1 Tax=Pterulicium gracile TaxID=1884261 RepID=A0A5C3QX59_9AGAR|nr:hypothetical protein BDV98DRAFT_603303 [Pterula gracilis]
MLLCSSSTLQAASDTRSLTIRCKTTLIMGDSSTPLVKLKKLLPSTLEVHPPSTGNLAFILSESIDGDKISREQLIHSPATLYFRRFLGSVSSEMGFSFLSPLFTDEGQDDTVNLSTTLSNFRATSSYPVFLRLQSIELKAIRFAPRKVDFFFLRPCSSASLIIPPPRRYPLVFGPMREKITRDNQNLSIIAQSLQRIVRRSHDEEFQEDCERHIAIIERNHRRSVSECKQVVVSLLPEENQQTHTEELPELSQEESVCLALNMLFVNNVRPPALKMGPARDILQDDAQRPRDDEDALNIVGSDVDAVEESMLWDEDGAQVLWDEDDHNHSGVSASQDVISWDEEALDDWFDGDRELEELGWDEHVHATAGSDHGCVSPFDELLWDRRGSLSPIPASTDASQDSPQCRVSQEPSPHLPSKRHSIFRAANLDDDSELVGANHCESAESNLELPNRPGLSPTPTISSQDSPQPNASFRIRPSLRVPTRSRSMYQTTEPLDDDAEFNLQKFDFDFATRRMAENFFDSSQHKAATSDKVYSESPAPRVPTRSHSGLKNGTELDLDVDVFVAGKDFHRIHGSQHDIDVEILAPSSSHSVYRPSCSSPFTGLDDYYTGLDLDDDAAENGFDPSQASQHTDLSVLSGSPAPRVPTRSHSIHRASCSSILTSLDDDAGLNDDVRESACQHAEGQSRHESGSELHEDDFWFEEDASSPVEAQPSVNPALPIHLDSDDSVTVMDTTLEDDDDDKAMLIHEVEEEEEDVCFAAPHAQFELFTPLEKKLTFKYAGFVDDSALLLGDRESEVLDF